MRRLILLRHGRTSWNDTGRAQGHADISLDEVGRAQAVAVAPYLASLDLVAIWTSDLARARETADIIGRAANLQVKSDQRFREYDVGERQGLTIPEAAARFPALGEKWEMGNPPPGVPGAETYADVAARIVAACREALDSLGAGETGLVVTHGACLKVALAGLFGWTATDAEALRGMENCHIATVEERTHDGRLRLRDYGVYPISHP